MKRPRTVDPNDTRSPMLRLLQDGQSGSGYVWVSYAAQWPTLFKAMRFGYLTDDSRLTDKGRKFLESQEA